MTKNEFKAYIKKKCYQYGFKKVKNMYYLPGEEVLCAIRLQKSNYGEIYYINISLFLGDYRETDKYPGYYDADLSSRLAVMSKEENAQGKSILTPMIKYEEYTEEELDLYLDQEFEKMIISILQQGKKYILDNVYELYCPLPTKKAQVLEMLKE